MDDKLSAAIQMAIVIIAEAANHLPDAMLTTHPAIPWSDIIGMGNRLKHNYHHTSSQVIWDTVTNDLPQLRLVVTAMIAVLEKDEVPA